MEEINRRDKQELSTSETNKLFRVFSCTRKHEQKQSRISNVGQS